MSESGMEKSGGDKLPDIFSVKSSGTDVQCQIIVKYRSGAGDEKGDHIDDDQRDEHFSAAFRFRIFAVIHIITVIQAHISTSIMLD